MIPSGAPLAWLAQPDGWPSATRQASAENPTGRHGGGCSWGPDPSNPNLPFSRPAELLGQGSKVSPYVRLDAGDTLTLADVRGEGVITHLYLTSDLHDYGQLRLRCWWDDQPAPSVDTPAANFFAIGHPTRPHEVSSLPVVVGPARGCSSWWPMPFRHHARITLTNTGEDDAGMVAYRVTWNHQATSGRTAHFNAQYRRSRTSPASPDHIIADIAAGPGLYVGTALSLDPPIRECGGWFLDAAQGAACGVRVA
jgi:hypothetical protein